MKSSIASRTKACLVKALTPALLATAITILGPVSSTGADKGGVRTPNVFPPGSAPYGKQYSEWSAAWWQWAYSIPADQNPVADSTGEFSDVGQRGPVFFLAGNFGGVTVRECNVPSGKGILLPLFNVPWVQFPTDPPYTIPELRDILGAFAANPVLACEIDGRAVPNLLDYREQSIVFSVTVPPGNLLGLDPGTYEPCVDEGYYLMLPPFSPGRHTLHFAASNSDGSFSLDVTYHLTVLPNPRRGHDGKFQVEDR